MTLLKQMHHQLTNASIKLTGKNVEDAFRDVIEDLQKRGLTV